jgi:hypothetical protein
MLEKFVWATGITLVLTAFSNPTPAAISLKDAESQTNAVAVNVANTQQSFLAFWLSRPTLPF